MKISPYDNFSEILKQIPIVKKTILKSVSAREAVAEVDLLDGSSFAVHIHLLKQGYPKKIRELSERLVQDACNIVSAPYISPVSEQICKSMNIGYIDAAGNCLFQYHSIYMKVTGNKNREIPK